ERDVPIPVLGPDLIDLRTLEITAERTAQGLVEAREEGLVKPAKIPAPQPPSAEVREVASEAGAGAPKGPSKLDLIRAKAKGDSPEAGAPAGPRPGPPKPAAKPAKKVKVAEARPSLVWLGEAGLKELVGRLNGDLGGGTAQIVHAGILLPAEKLIQVALYL